MAIYDLGTASLSANGEVNGAGTTWKAPLTLIRIGATIVFKTEPVKIYTISEIISDTQINVYNPNSETVPAGTGYAILAHDGITVQGLAQDVAETLRYYQSRETEVSTAVDIFKDFDQDKFSIDVNQVNTQFGEIVTIGSQVSSDASQVSADKDAAYASSISAQNSANIAESAAESVSGALVGNFYDGVTLQSKNQVIIQFINGYARQFLWSGEFPKVVPAGSTPETSGGIGLGAWVSVGDVSLRTELYEPGGAGLSGYDDSITYQDGTVGSAVKDKNFRKEIIYKLPFQFDGYATALAAIGAGSVIYPQGADYDDDGLLFINYTPNAGGALRVIVVYNQAGEQVTWFYSPNSSGQSVAVTGNSTSRRLYDRRLGDDIVYYYDITSLPLAGTTLSGHTATNIQSAGSHLCVSGNLLFCTMNDVPVGGSSSQTVINVYALDTGSKQGTINVSQMLTGFGTPDISPTYYYKVWKIQGLAYKNGLLHIGIGGSYRPEYDDAKNPVHDIGVVRVNLQGDIVDHSVVKADGLMSVMAANGCTISRTESEGCFIHPDGTVHTLLVGDLANATPSTPNGIVILREFSKTGFDAKEAASGFTPLPNTAFNRLMRAEQGLLQNPVLKTTFTSVTEILDLMAQFNLTEFTWFSTVAPSLTTITGLNYVTGQLYTVRNLNNGSFVIETSGVTTGYQSYSVVGSLGSWTATRSNVIGSEFVLDNAGAAASLTYLASTGKKVGVFRANYSGTSTPLVIGAGGTLTPTAVFIYTNPTVTDEGSGVQSLQVYGTAVLPGTNSAQTLGNSAFKWTQVFADTATINTSDIRNKVDPVELNEAEKQVATVLKGLVRRYKMKNAVQAKGINAARYHIGVIAQEVEKAFADAGLNGFDYGILCYDEWDAVEAEYDEEGNLLRAASPAGNGYAIRYEELLCFIIAAI